MAIKVNGTEVISDSRALNNIASVDATTAASITAAGVGGGGPTLEATASGALANGDLVVVNSDGTVSVVFSTPGALTVTSGTTFETNSITYSSTAAVYDPVSGKVVVLYSDSTSSNQGYSVVGTVSGTSITFGSRTLFETGNTTSISAAFDVGQSKVVAFYRDGGNSNRGTACVGTISGTSVTWGSTSVFETGATSEISATYDANAQKTVVFYADDSDGGKGKAVVCDVSSGSPVFGSETTFETGSAGSISATYDANAQKCVVAYDDNGNSSYGTACVGTVSGTSISFGTPVVFRSASVEYVAIGYDSDAQKVVVAYHDNGNSSYSTAKVGTVSGTSISFGTATVFSTTDNYVHSVAYNPAVGKIYIVYSDGDERGSLSMGTVSGTSISFDTAVEIVDGALYSQAYDSTAEKMVVAYRETITGDGKTALAYTAPDTINLTSGNFIGISDGAYADTATATVQIVGSVDDAQSGLTAGQAYYVQTDGTLGTTPDDPSVFAGTAVSATKIIVKG